MTDKFKFTAKTGEVKAFSTKTGTGVVIVGRKRYPFDATSFRVMTYARYPKSGEKVKAILSDDGTRLVSLWAVKEASSSRSSSAASKRKRSSHAVV